MTIAGFDPSSGAGVTADLAVMSAHAVFGVSCMTALTVQSTVGVKRWQAAGAPLVAETLRWLTDDLPPAGVKIGMLADRATVLAVADFLSTLPRTVPVVLDPVLRSSSGRALLEDAGIEAVSSVLLPRVDWMTPNVDELSLLADLPAQTSTQMLEAAALLRNRNPHLGLVVTGGDLPEPDDFVTGPALQPVWLRGTHLETKATHGTGCAFSTALLCGLMQGQNGVEAARNAKHFVFEAMRRATPRGSGKGPMNLLWPLRPMPGG